MFVLLAAISSFSSFLIFFISCDSFRWNVLLASLNSMFISLTGGGEFVVLNPKVSLFGRLLGFKKWNAFHRIRRRNDSVLSIKHCKYSCGCAFGTFLVEYPRLTGFISVRRVLNNIGAKYKNKFVETIWFRVLDTLVERNIKKQDKLGSILLQFCFVWRSHTPQANDNNLNIGSAEEGKITMAYCARLLMLR